MGAPKKPMALRALQGTDKRNKQRINKDAPKASRGIGEPPEHFNASQKRTWEYLISIMYEGVLSESDRPTFEILTCLFNRFRSIDYSDPEANFMGAAELTLMHRIMATYGMSPADREKITVKKEEKANPFESV